MKKRTVVNHKTVAVLNQSKKIPFNYQVPLKNYKNFDYMDDQEGQIL